jgi:hypothetical protein
VLRSRLQDDVLHHWGDDVGGYLLLRDRKGNHLEDLSDHHVELSQLGLRRFLLVNSFELPDSLLESEILNGNLNQLLLLEVLNVYLLYFLEESHVSCFLFSLLENTVYNHLGNGLIEHLLLLSQIYQCFLWLIQLF